MAAGKCNLVIEQGAKFHRRLIWKDANDLPIDVTSYKAQMQIKTGYGGKLIHTLYSGKGIELKEDGIIDLTISSEVTKLFKDKQGIYDLELVDSEGEVIRLLEGTVSISFEVTTYDS